MRRMLIIVGSIVVALLVIGGCSVLAFRGNGEAVSQTATARPNVSVGVVATPTPGPTLAGTKTAPVIVKTATPAAPTLPVVVQATSVSTATAVPTVVSTPPAVVLTTTADYKLDWTASWYQSPFVGFTKPQLADKATNETFAEPGKNLDETAAFDHMTSVTTPLLVPEGATTYVAIGSMCFSNVNFAYVARNIYLFIFRGIPSDGKPETDLNRIVNASCYTPGTGIFDALRAGAYVSQDWFIDQIKNSGRSPNCGEGCQTVTVVIVDLKTATYRQWTTTPSNPTVWVRK